MTKVRVLYFAGLRDLVGMQEETVELENEVTTVADFVEQLERLHPRLAGRFRSVRVAVNETFAPNTLTLSDGDVVALIPPVAGG